MSVKSYVPLFNFIFLMSKSGKAAFSALVSVFIESCKYFVPALTSGPAVIVLKIDLACGELTLSKAVKKLLNMYFAVAALNNACPPFVALIPNSLAPSAPIIILNCFMASAD